MTSAFQKLSREEALKELESLIAEFDASWERDGLDWAPPLMDLFREIISEANKKEIDAERLRMLHDRVYAYFRKHRFLKGIGYSLGWIDTICGCEKK